VKNKSVIDLCSLFFICRIADIEMITSVFLKKLFIINRMFFTSHVKNKNRNGRSRNG